MQYLVTFTDGSQGIFSLEQLNFIISTQPELIVSYVVYQPEPEPTPTDEELIYANWQRTGGTGSMAYWRSLGSPLYYTPPPEPEPTPTDEELIYANWQRTGGTGSMAYWRSLGSPLFYTPEPEPEPEPLEGTIVGKELEYSGSGDGAVPVANVPQGVRAKLHVWGRNDMSVSQGMGIYWFVADPDGMIAEEYTDWGGTIGSYPTDHEFISSGQFDLNKVGKYTTWIELRMGTQASWEVVARYIGELCTVVSLVPEYKGSIAKKELEYDGNKKPIPVY